VDSIIREAKFSFWRVVWALSLLTTILLTWADLRAKVLILESDIVRVYTKPEIDAKLQALADEDRILKIRIKNLEHRLGIISGE
jgi:hypothetical protein